MCKVNSRNTRTRWEICTKLTIKTPEGPRWRCSGVFIVNFVHVSHLVLMFLLLTLSVNYKALLSLLILIHTYQQHNKLSKKVKPSRQFMVKLLKLLTYFCDFTIKRAPSRMFY